MRIYQLISVIERCLVLLALTALIASPVYAKSSTTVIRGGLSESVTLIKGTNDYSLKGWACVKNLASSINVSVYVGGQAGSGGVLLGTYLASEPSSADIATRCNVPTGLNYRFKIQLAADIVAKYSGQNIYVYGLVPEGMSGSDTLLNPVTNVIMPSVVPGTATPTPVPTPTATPVPTPSPAGPPSVKSSVPAFQNFGPFAVGTMRNITYGTALDANGATVNLLMDIYYPLITSSPLPQLPVILQVHGGAWKSGDKTSCFRMDALKSPVQDICNLQAARGYVVATVNYRLSGGGVTPAPAGSAIFPAPIEDVKGAVRYLRRNADAFTQFKIDTTRIGAFGSSAGGHLVNILGASAGVVALQGTNNLGYSDDVQVVGSVFGPSDLTQIDAQFAATKAITPGFNPTVHSNSSMSDASISGESAMLGCALNSKPECNVKAASANPITYITNQSPPYIFRHGRVDIIVPYQQSQIMDSALRAVGVYSDIRILEGIGHNFNSVICETGVTCSANTLGSDDARKAYEEVMAFFDKVLRGN